MRQIAFIQRLQALNYIPYRRIVCLMLLLAHNLVAFAADDVNVQPIPTWVTTQPFTATAESISSQIAGGIFYLLVDTQVQVNPQGVRRFHRFAQQAVNEEGIVGIAQIAIDFDPAYQTLTLHEINIIRDGVTTRKLDKQAVNVLQREKDLEYQIYDGRKTANVILEDVRVGDIVDYSYTVSGSNPIFENQFMDGVELQWAVPVANLRYRLLWPKHRKLYIKPQHTDIALERRETASHTEYQLSLHDIAALLSDGELPAWYDPYPWVQLSEYQSWEQIVNWALPLYKVPGKISPEVRHMVREIARRSADKKQQLYDVLQFTQNEIRYMGIEMGVGSHAPSHPAAVLQRRFGDCKDKAMLMLTMLDALKIKAQPALVNTRMRRTLAELQPTPTAFNHVIVKAHLDGDAPYWLDPTRMYQKGDLETVSQPDYDLALVLDNGVTGLETMHDARSIRRKVVVDTFDLRLGVGAPAS